MQSILLPRPHLTSSHWTMWSVGATSLCWQIASTWTRWKGKKTATAERLRVWSAILEPRMSLGGRQISEPRNALRRMSSLVPSSTLTFGLFRQFSTVRKCALARKAVTPSAMTPVLWNAGCTVWARFRKQVAVALEDRPSHRLVRNLAFF